MDATVKKQKGIHYTPPELARFLARQTARCLDPELDRISLLDPACGDGELMVAMIEAINGLGRSRVEVEVSGFEIDPAAADRCRARLDALSFVHVRMAKFQIHNRDFLASHLDAEPFDCVISNPPYVRTQVLGGEVAQQLAKKFELTGRVDLYQAFSIAIASVLKVGGALGLLTSNRFLTVRSGAAMRRLLRKNFDLAQVFDLGDTRLFEAAVLPVVLTGNKKEAEDPVTRETSFCRVYRSEKKSADQSGKSCGLIGWVENQGFAGEVQTDDGRYLIERGELVAESDDAVWSLGNAATRKWLQTIRSSQKYQFDDLGEIKVGIKTTADAVFIQQTSDWNSLEHNVEPGLLQPLITHDDAQRWAIAVPQKSVLYPYAMDQPKRTPLSITDFPGANRYLGSHRERLERRKYLIDAGRNWYEIWVPHQPAVWKELKLVWPDISESPRFFIDASGAIVNGDCYWIKLREGVESDWLYLMLAVANSEVATTFYDTMFHNKLYASRRRFMTQYVKEFPLPDLTLEPCRQIVRLVKRLVADPTPEIETEVEALVQRAFELTTE